MKRCYYVLIVICLFTILNSCGKKTVKSYSPQNKVCDLSNSSESLGDYYATQTKENIIIDGSIEDTSWAKAPWRDIKYDWSGSQYTPQNFYGRYKILWNEQRLYFLIETTDNILVQENKESGQWEHKDFLELYIDEGRSKEGDEYNRQSLIYSLGTDERIVLASSKEINQADKEIIHGKRASIGNKSIWEVAMKVVKNSNVNNKTTVIDTLTQGDIFGFAIAYHDYDGPNKNENFVGSIKLPYKDKAHAGNDPSSLGILELIK